VNTTQVHVERRAAQRFEFHLPVSIRVAGRDGEAHGFTRDLSARGAFFYTEFALTEGDSVELTVTMPSEITLAENMRVRCQGKVTRSLTVEGKFGPCISKNTSSFPSLPASSQQPLNAFQPYTIATENRGKCLIRRVSQCVDRRAVTDSNLVETPCGSRNFRFFFLSIWLLFT